MALMWGSHRLCFRLRHPAGLCQPIMVVEDAVHVGEVGGGMRVKPGDEGVVLGRVRMVVREVYPEAWHWWRLFTHGSLTWMPT